MAQNPFAILAIPDALKLWLAGITINVIRWLEMPVFALFALQISGSPFLVALTGFARVAPMLLASLSTAYIDRFQRRSVLIVICVVLVIMDAALLIFVWEGSLHVWHLIAAAFISGVCWTIENPLRRTMLAEIGGRHRFGASMGLDVASNQLLRGVGPAIGGVLFAYSGIEGVLIFGLVLHAITAPLFILVASTKPQSPANVRPSFIRNMIDAINYTLKQRLLMGTLVITAVFNMFGFPYTAILPVFAEQVFTMSSVGIGFLFAAESMGAGLGCILIALWLRPIAYVPTYVIGSTGFLACTFVFGFLNDAAFAYPLLFIGGLGFGAFATMQMTIPLHACAPELRIRVLGLVTVCIGTSTLGFLNAGWLAEWLGPSMAQIIIALEGLLSIGLTVWIWPETLHFKEPKPNGGCNSS